MSLTSIFSGFTTCTWTLTILKSQYLLKLHIWCLPFYGAQNRFGLYIFCWYIYFRIFARNRNKFGNRRCWWCGTLQLWITADAWSTERNRQKQIRKHNTVRGRFSMSSAKHVVTQGQRTTKTYLSGNAFIFVPSGWSSAKLVWTKWMKCILFKTMHSSCRWFYDCWFVVCDTVFSGCKHAFFPLPVDEIWNAKMYCTVCLQ